MTNRHLSLVPRPLDLQLGQGDFLLTPTATITAEGPGAVEVAGLLGEYLRPATGFGLPVEAGSARGNGIHLVAEGDLQPDEAGFSSEVYQIDITTEGVTLRAETAAGLARGIQTLRQLFPVEIFGPEPVSQSWTLPCLHIADRPRFRWRGLHLDVSRHFFAKDAVCRFIDLLALHRLNVLHLHLTDDQGWRIEIPKYPRLTEVGAWRRESLVGHERERPRRYDGVRHGGFFTTQDIREIVAFAARRHVNVVPEIEMPGHAQAAVAAYPEFGNGWTTEPRCHWGISQHIYNPDDRTIRFLCDVLDEVMTLFPSRFIHVGGDEALKREWSESRHVQARMAELGLTSEDALQSWFLSQVGRHIEQAGRRMIGWDEILEGGLPSGAAVMSWRGEEGGMTAARAGHDVVMTPQKSVYFDHYQADRATQPLAISGLTTTEDVYGYNPLPEALEPEFAHHVLGSQAQLWSEYIPDAAQLDYMTYPRACALAEALWLPVDARDFTRFSTALAAHRARLDALDVNACPLP